jgi:16S rRNA U516 pseudouridylate synthase RsuA-like enzyme
VEVNGKKVTELGAKADAAKDSIRVDGKLVADIEDRVYYVLFKPSGCVTTMNDPEGRSTVQDYLKQVRERVYPVGRLDYDAEGALLLTNDGELAHRLMHPKFGARRTYLAKVKGEPTEKTIEKLRAGVQRLLRSSYAGVSVDSMMAGELRELSSAEVRQLKGRSTAKPGTADSGRSGLPPRRDARRTAFKPRTVGKKHPR